MKSFDRLREQSLEEKLKSSDPTGKWISDFVHSDNPKFAGKSKKERIRMALGASYAAKRNEEVELEEGTYKHDVEKAFPAPGVKTIQPKHKYSTMPTDKEKAKAQPAGKMKEEAEQIDELRTSTLMRYNTKAHASANKLTGQASRAMDNDDRETASKLLNKRDNREVGIDRSRAKIQKNVANKLKKEEVELEENDLSKFSKYVIKSVKTEPKIVRKTNPAGRTSDHVEYEVHGTVSSQKRTFKSKKDAEAYYRTIKEEVDKGISRAVDKLAKEAVQIEEGSAQSKLYGIQQKLRQKSKLPHPDYYKELGKSYDIEDDKERLSKQSEIKKKYKVEEGSIEGGVWTSKSPKKGQPEVDPPSAIVEPIDKNAKDTTTIKPGLGDLNKVFDKLDRENAAKAKKQPKMNEEDSQEHVGTGVSKSMQMAKDIADANARNSMMRKKYGDNFTDKPFPNSSVRYEFKPGDKSGTYHATAYHKENPVKEGNSFSKIRNNLAEVKKMKGEDPCWDDYKMIGTKMKNGKQVPNCVPKESVAEAKEEQEYDYEGDMAMSDLRSILHNAKTVHDMLEPNTNIPEWCQSKITLAEDYISTVANYMRGEMSEEVQIDEAKPGLYANIHAKRKRIKGGSGERMRKPGAKGAPTAQAFRDSAKTAKK